MGTDRSFNRNQQRDELKRVLGSIKTDKDKAEEIARQVGGSVHLFERPKPGGLIGFESDQAGSSLESGPENQGRTTTSVPRDATPRSRADGQIVCADIGDPPPGCALPTHLRMGGVIYFLIPPGDYEDGLQEAFERGYADCRQHVSSWFGPLVPGSEEKFPAESPNPLSYKLRMVSNEWNDYDDQQEADNDQAANDGEQE